MKHSNREYVPALGYDALTQLYDPVVRMVTRERTFKACLIDQANVESNHHVLDVGCGTGTLTVWLKQQHPDAQITGLDGDEKVLGIASDKASKLNLTIRFDKALSDELPYANESFDRVVSSLLFHHLNRDAKVATLLETWRVLRPSGELHIADWGRPTNVLMRALFFTVQILDGFETTSDNVQGELPELIRDAGFGSVAERTTVSTVCGTLSLYSARKTG